MPIGGRRAVEGSNKKTGNFLLFYLPKFPAENGGKEGGGGRIGAKYFGFAGNPFPGKFDPAWHVRLIPVEKNLPISYVPPRWRAVAAAACNYQNNKQLEE